MIIRKNSVLLLNADSTFLNTINIRKSLSLWARGKARILKSSNVVIHPGLNLNQPEVMILNHYIYVPYKFRQVKLSREAIMLRDNFTCQYSGARLKKSEIQIDHIIPRSRGGKNTWENLVCSSNEINNRKGNRTPEEAGLKLIKKPSKPTISDLLNNMEKERWSEFIDE